MIFAEAGIGPGMRVLDLGCGAGDVAFVAAYLVGPDGRVVGVDRSADALARARLRAGRRGLAQVQFVEGDINDRAPGGPFDAIVERLVLWAVPDPAALLGSAFGGRNGSSTRYGKYAGFSLVPAIDRRIFVWLETSAGNARATTERA